MEKIVYLLGAGFSAPLGLPLASNFLEKSKDLYFHDTKKYSHFEQVFKKIDEMHKSKTYYQTDLLNIEEILSILEMQSQVDSQIERKVFADYIIDVINYYTPQIRRGERGEQRTRNLFGHAYGYGSFISALFHIDWDEIGGSLPGSIDYYPSISRELPGFDYSVITLNYDLVLENLAKFVGANSSVKLEFKRNWETTPLTPGNVYLAKLHGSIDAGDIIPPTWNKSLVDKRIISSWKLAFKLLEQANQIRIVGYSLPETDSYVRYLLKAAVLNAPNLKRIHVICLDPDGTVEHRYREFVAFRNFSFKTTGVQQYLEYASGNGASIKDFSGNIETLHRSQF